MRALMMVAGLGLAVSNAGAGLVPHNQDITTSNGERWIFSNNGSPSGYRLQYALTPGASSDAIDYVMPRVGQQWNDPLFNGAVEAIGNQVDRQDYPEGVKLTTLGDTFHSDIVATTEYFVFDDRPVMRIITRLENTSADITLAPAFANVGIGFNADGTGNFDVVATSSGDTDITTDDLWFVRDDFSKTGGRAGVVSVLGDGEGIADVGYVNPSQRYSGTDRNGVEAIYDSIAIQPGETLLFMQFVELDLNTQDGIPDMSIYENLGSLHDAGLLVEMGSSDIAGLQNWYIPTPGTAMLAGLGLAWASRRRRSG